MSALSFFQKKRKDHKFLFILSPPYSGSTLLMRILETSKNVSSFHTEGQFIKGMDKLMRKGAWDVSTEMPWEKIKPVWLKYWQLKKQVLLEKSPPNLLRAQALEHHFPPAYFIGLIRNPYAFCEGVIRRLPENNHLRENFGANFWVLCARAQKQNMESLENHLQFRYEDLVEDVDETATKIKAFLPVLDQLQVEGKFLAQSKSGYKKREIQNLNPEKIATLDQGQLDTINTILEKELPLLETFGYTLIEKASTKLD